MFLEEDKKKKVFVALSGGVDSSVSALLLKEATKPKDFRKIFGCSAPKGFKGFDVYTGFIKGYNVDGCQDKEAEDARLVAEKIGVPFYIFDFEKEYKEKVVDYLLNGYKKGITPNPDVVCNSQIKFGLFYDEVMEIGADFVASGHYVSSKLKIQNLKSIFGDKKLMIYKGKDKNKDQSYFLWQVPYDRFQKMIFPIGNLKKEKVREIAKRAGLLTAEKKDSQGICFLGKFNFDDFLKEKIGEKKGIIVDLSGKVVGEHSGAWLYTRGQRHGFVNTAGRPFYVIRKDLEKNVLVVAYEEDEKYILEKEINVLNLNFLDNDFKNDFKQGKTKNIYLRTRYRQKLFRAEIQKSGDGARIVFKKPQKNFSTSGQSAVFYTRWGQMVGGGVID